MTIDTFIVEQGDDAAARDLKALHHPLIGH
jgi:hypothetical protein